MTVPPKLLSRRWPVSHERKHVHLNVVGLPIFLHRTAEYPLRSQTAIISGRLKNELARNPRPQNQSDHPNKDYEPILDSPKFPNNRRYIYDDGNVASYCGCENGSPNQPHSKNHDRLPRIAASFTVRKSFCENLIVRVDGRLRSYRCAAHRAEVPTSLQWMQAFRTQRCAR
jgi:hypothetical protein